MTNEELMHAVGNAAAVVKLVCGVGNNAAWLVMMDAYDHARRCKAIRRSVKGGHMVGWYFTRAINEFKDYERRLLTTNENRMFHLADMSEEIRRKYGDISDAEYYEFWKGVGGVAYAKTKPMITSLWNKYRVSLIQHCVKDAEHIAWVMTAQATLDLAVLLYEQAIKDYEKSSNIPHRILTNIFDQFSLDKVSKAWRQGLDLMYENNSPINLTDIEERNISHGINQLTEAWMDPETLYSSASEAVDDYNEIFATKGFVKKVQQEIAMVKEDTLKEYAAMDEQQ